MSDRDREREVSVEIEADFPSSAMDANREQPPNERETRTLDVEQAGLEEDSLTDVPLAGSKGVVESEKELVDENLTLVNSEQTNAVQISADALSKPPLQPQKQDRNDRIEFVMGPRHWPGKALSLDEGPSLKWGFKTPNQEDDDIVWKDFPSPKINVVNQIK